MDRTELIERVTEEVMRRLSEAEEGRTTSSAETTGLSCDAVDDSVRTIIASGADRVSAPCGVDDVRRTLAEMIDHTLLKADASADDIRTLCEEAKRCGFASVCVNPCWVALSASLLRLTSVKVCTVVGFPLGATLPEAKAYEAERAIAAGAQEIDMVANIGALKSGDDALVERDIRAVVEACRGIAVLKVIIEAALLTDDEKVRACRIAQTAGADFVKTSTGFGPGGATPHDVALMRETVGAWMGVKAAGGIRDLETAREMVQAGATRIGASASVKIIGC